MTRFATFLFSFVFAVSSGYPQPDTNSEGKAKPSETFLLNGISKLIGQNRQETRKRLGQPTKVLIENRANTHLPEEVDSIVSLHFPGATIRYFVPGKGDSSNEFVIEAEATSSSFRFEPGINIGSKMNFVIKTLGFPNVYSRDSLVYEDDLQNKATLYFKKMSLVKVKWEFYWD